MSFPSFSFDIIADGVIRIEPPAPCHFCNCEAVDPVRKRTGLWTVRCRGCKAEGPEAENEARAIREWNK